MAQSRLRVVVRGAVQGVGYRPFVFRLASELRLNGWVVNSSQGVFIEVEGNKSAVDTFNKRIRLERPPHAIVLSCEVWQLDPIGYERFEIRESNDEGEKSVLVLPDIATCAECKGEIFDHHDRRFGYPFTNCTNCGPRYSIIRQLPYDRAKTTMAGFKMCSRCQNEYNDPTNRRFHAQPNACPECGPQLSLLDSEGNLTNDSAYALEETVLALKKGEIVAVKGIGGFHLMVDATNADAVLRLRQRKKREHKPLAVMAPSLGWVKKSCVLSAQESRALTSSEAPIVLLRKKASEIAQGVAPRNPYLGVMLPYTPLHWLLLQGFGGPLVATSGNLTDEPICIDNNEAVQRLKGIADRFLVHDRPIERHVDDSIVRVIDGREMVLRRARGYAPLPVMLPRTIPTSIAFGAHLKSAIAFNVGDKAFISQHIGDLESAEALQAFERVTSDVSKLYALEADSFACDLHPDYASTRAANQRASMPLYVQHHYAHVLSCMVDNDVEPPCLGVAWDGVGLGSDKTLWGGEFIKVDPVGWHRVGHLWQLRLPGGDQAVRQPWRLALSAIVEAFGDQAHEIVSKFKGFSVYDHANVLAMLQKGINCPISTGAGRLFDAVSALCGICHETRFEGQAAMELEFACDESATADPYPMPVNGQILDWRPTIRKIVADLLDGKPVGVVSYRFHQALVNGISEMAVSIGEQKVLLTGGCFQNRILLEQTIKALRKAGVTPYWHQRIPTNDGGIAVGQLMALAREQGK